MVLQTTDGGCLYADVLKTDFRSKWPSKNNFTELDISQSLDWQYPSLSPYYLLVLPYLARSLYFFFSSKKILKQKQTTTSLLPNYIIPIRKGAGRFMYADNDRYTDLFYLTLFSVVFFYWYVNIWLLLTSET